MNNIVDINKKYTTRDEREVVIFEVSDRVYCKIKCSDGWAAVSRQLSGMLYDFGKYSNSDLILAKTWRAWKKEEVPKLFMAQHKISRGQRIACANGDESTKELSYLFTNYDWLHEDGTTTPCGVLDG